MTRFKQAAAITVGLVGAVVMLWLGLWQYRVYVESGSEAARQRAVENTVALQQVAPAGREVTDGFGRIVTFRGSYDPGSQILVPDPDDPGRYRVVTALVQSDGTAVPVVRGTFTGPAGLSGPDGPPPPTGTVAQQGLLLPSEPTDDTPVAAGQLSTVRVSVLAQTWPWPLTAGFVTLDQPLAAAQGLEYREPELPREGGELRNGAYAMQWWVFAAFSVGMGVKAARDIGRTADEQSDENEQAADDVAAESETEPIEAPVATKETP
ncbi:SURF1 family protein [Propionibacteriaceae bacterium Y1700]|uniref:SURF1 family protein n=1 Tax=Microlunatus sp. Y1700 TaxID=3418487 RepID=UPI003DA6FB48